MQEQDGPQIEVVGVVGEVVAGACAAEDAVLDDAEMEPGAGGPRVGQRIEDRRRPDRR